MRLRLMQDEETGLELCGLDYLDYWLQCVHVFTASYYTGAATTPSSGAAVVGHLSPAVFIVGTNRTDLHDDPDQQLKLVGRHHYDFHR